MVPVYMMLLLLKICQITVICVIGSRSYTWIDVLGSKSVSYETLHS